MLVEFVTDKNDIVTVSLQVDGTEEKENLIRYLCQQDEFYIRLTPVNKEQGTQRAWKYNMPENITRPMRNEIIENLLGSTLHKVDMSQLEVNQLGTKRRRQSGITTFGVEIQERFLGDSIGDHDHGVNICTQQLFDHIMNIIWQPNTQRPHLGISY